MAHKWTQKPFIPSLKLIGSHCFRGAKGDTCLVFGVLLYNECPRWGGRTMAFHPKKTFARLYK